MISHISKALSKNRKRKHKPQDCALWESKYLKAKSYKLNPNQFCSADAKTIQNWIRNQRSTEMTEEMQKKWLELGEYSGISNEVMIHYWKQNKNHQVCQKWANNKRKQRKRLTDREKQWLVRNNVLSRNDLYDFDSEPLCIEKVSKQTFVTTIDRLKDAYSKMHDQTSYISRLTNHIIVIGDELLRINEEREKFGENFEILYKEVVKLIDHQSEEILQTK